MVQLIKELPGTWCLLWSAPIWILAQLGLLAAQTEETLHMSTEVPTKVIVTAIVWEAVFTLAFLFSGRWILGGTSEGEGEVNN